MQKYLRRSEEGRGSVSVTEPRANGQAIVMRGSGAESSGMVQGGNPHSTTLKFKRAKLHTYSIGTMISFARAILSRSRAADSM